MKKIKPASHTTTNQRVFELITNGNIANKRILDIGAGSGYMAQKIGNYIHEQGGRPDEQLTACDLFPEYFEYDGVKCEKLTFLTSLPYPDNSFDIIYAIEVIEHLRSPYDFIKETYRVVSPGGKVIITTPNILNLTSRLSFLFKGFFTLFGPVSLDDRDAGRLAGHIMPLSCYYLDYGFRKEGFSQIELNIDRVKKSSLFIYILLFTFGSPIARISSVVLSSESPHAITNSSTRGSIDRIASTTG